MNSQEDDRRAAAERKRKMEEMKEGVRKLNREEVSAVAGGAGGGGASTFTVIFVSPRHVALFCKAAASCNGSVKLTQGAKTVDGKKVLQTMSLNQNEPVTVTLSDPEDRAYLSDF